MNLTKGVCGQGLTLQLGCIHQRILSMCISGTNRKQALMTYSETNDEMNSHVRNPWESIRMIFVLVLMSVRVCVSVIACLRVLLSYLSVVCLSVISLSLCRVLCLLLQSSVCVFVCAIGMSGVHAAMRTTAGTRASYYACVYNSAYSHVHINVRRPSPILA